MLAIKIYKLNVTVFVLFYDSEVCDEQTQVLCRQTSQDYEGECLYQHSKFCCA